MIPILPEPRLFGLLLAPAVIVVASTWEPPLIWLAAALLALALLAAALDLRASIRPSQIGLSRSHDALLSVGAANVITLSVENNSSQPLTYHLRDESPDEFRTSRVVAAGNTPPRARSEIAYTVVPLRRGAYTFGNINLRYHSAYGLLELQTQTATQDTVAVYPDVLELRKHTLTARGAEQETVNRLRARGGTEFERLRDYTPDDEYRYIDWNATARVRRVIARQYQTERNQNIVLALDLGRQMTSQYGDLLKVDYAINSGVVLGYVGSQRGENIGLITFNDRVRSYLPPRSGQQQFRRLLDTLYAAQPELVEPDYREAFGYLALRNPRRSLVVVFTDVADRVGGRELVRSVSALQPKHLPMLVMLMDPVLKRYAEEEPADEAGLYQMAVAQRLLSERAALIKTLEARGVITIDVPAERLTVALLDSYLRVKARAAL